MKILFVSREFYPSLRTGGIGVILRDLTTGLVRRGHQVTVLSAADRSFFTRFENVDGVDIYRLGFPDFVVGKSIILRILNKLANYFLYDIYRYRIYRKIIKLNLKYNFDIVEVPDYANEAKYWLNNKYIPTVIRYHGPFCLNFYTLKIDEYDRRKRDECKSFLKADGHIFVSKALKRIVLTSLQVDPQKKLLEVIHNGIPLQKYYSISTVNSTHYDKNQTKPFRILGSGTISKLKGYDLLIEACSILNSQSVRVTLDLFGRHADLKNLISKVNKSCAISNPWIIAHGPIERSMLFRKYSEFDLCCFPSIFESFGLTIAEAMANGGLVLASNRGGPAEIISDGIDGFLFNPLDGSEKLADCIRRVMIMDSNNLSEIRQLAQKKIFENFSIEDCVNKTESMYLKICK